MGGAEGLTHQCGQVEDSHYRGARCTVPAFFSVSLCVFVSLFIYLVVVCISEKHYSKCKSQIIFLLFLVELNDSFALI